MLKSPYQTNKGKTMKKTFIFFGPPGAGKGTLASELTKTMDLVHISTGDMFRAEIASKSTLGLKVEEIISRGELVPDELTIDIMKTKLQSIEDKDVILDGFPRTVEQAQALDKMLASLHRTVDIVVSLEISFEVQKKRLLGRLVCKDCGDSYNTYSLKPKKEGTCDKCGGELYKRSDDTEETILNRFKQYQESTAPVAKYYKEKGLIKEYNADQGVIELQAIVAADLS